MRDVYFLIVFMILAFQTKAQSVQWFQTNHEWYYNVTCLTANACGYKHYSVVGDTIIAGREGLVLAVNTLEDFGQTQSEILIMHAGADTVFRYSPEAERWHMLYDMSAEVGDVWIIQQDEYLGFGNNVDNLDLFKVVVDEVNITIVIGEERRTVLAVPVYDDNDLSDYSLGMIIEGIGPVGGAHGLIGQPTAVTLPPQNPSFQCFLEGGDLVFGSADAPCNTLSTANAQQQHAFELYPNPAYDHLFLKLPKDSGQAWQLRIVDMQGRLVMGHAELPGGGVNVGHLPPGMYVLQVSDADGWYGQRKFVKCNY